MVRKARTTKSKPATFVIVHGAWTGSWSWLRVIDRLAAKGHKVFAPALSGLGERSHLARSGINLTTHIDDIANEIRWKDLDQIVLVGHSYGGFVISGVAEQLLERIAAIVYVDAFIPEDGQAFADLGIELDTADEVIPPPPSSAGDYLDDADRAWVDSKATAQPRGTFTEQLRVTGAYQRVPHKTYIRATHWESPFADARVGSEWHVYEIASGHDIPIDKPDELAAILHSIARESLKSIA
jgi:pimeloyl-ACP methyl ester carboxylesterase